MSKFYGNVGKGDYINLIDERVPLWKFLEHYLKPSGWVVSLAHQHSILPEEPKIFDCGAIAYKKQDIPKVRGEIVNSQWAIYQQKLLAKPGDIVMAPDTLLLPGTDLQIRRRFNRNNAEEFIGLCKRHLDDGISPMAVCHGLSVDERIECAQLYYKMGYRYIGIGGLVPTASNRRYCSSVVAEIKRALPNDCKLHVLGLCSPSYAAAWDEMGIWSFDGRTFQVEATYGSDFYETIGCLIKHHPVAYPGEPITAPPCLCPVCARLRCEGFDPRVSGTRQSSIGRICHNLGQFIAAQRNAITRRSITLISCVGKKRSVPSVAADLYCSQWWKAARRYAEMNGAHWMALSALHGVVAPDYILEPYDFTLKGKPVALRRNWSEKVVEQLNAIASPRGCEVVFLCGKRYREFVVPKLLHDREKLYTTRLPLAGLAGIGYQLQWFRINTPRYLSVQLSLL